MKYFNYSICLFILSLSLFACKKSNDHPSVTTIATNWGEDLKGTIWAGDFNYTSGAYLGSQPFSMDLKEDGTIMWYDVTSERAGGTWTVKDSTVTFTFPSNTSFHATVAKDKWSHLTMDPSSGFLINSISRSARPDPAMLAGASYSGIIDVYVSKINITSSSSLEFHYGASGFQYASYSISGGGIRFNEPGSPFDSRYYLMVQNNYTVLKGVHCIFGINPRTYSSLTLTKN
jgi:hypothetical protein